MRHTTDIRWFLQQLSNVAAYANADYNVPNATYTIVPYNTERYDQKGEYNTISRRYTPEYTGYALWNICIPFPVAAAAYDATIVIECDLGTPRLAGVYSIQPDFVCTIQLSGVIAVTEGKWYIVKVEQNSGGPLLFEGSELITYFSITRIPLVA